MVNDVVNLRAVSLDGKLSNFLELNIKC